MGDTDIIKRKVTETYFKKIGLSDEEVNKVIDTFGCLMEMLKYSKSTLKEKLDENFDSKTSNLILNSMAV